MRRQSLLQARAPRSPARSHPAALRRDRRPGLRGARSSCGEGNIDSDRAGRVAERAESVRDGIRRARGLDRGG